MRALEPRGGLPAPRVKIKYSRQKRPKFETLEFVTLLIKYNIFLWILLDSKILKFGKMIN